MTLPPHVGVAVLLLTLLVVGLLALEARWLRQDRRRRDAMRRDVQARRRTTT